MATNTWEKMRVLETPADVAEVWASNDYQHFGPEWYAWGDKVAAMVGDDALDRVILEWGSGGGAILRALQGRAREYFAVDISPRARQACHDLGAKVLDPAEASSRATPYVDTVISVACFQHFPTKLYARQVLGILRRSLRGGGFGLVQVRIGDEPRESQQPYKNRFIDGIAWTAPEFWFELQREGFSPTFVRLEDDYGWFTFRG